MARVRDRISLSGLLATLGAVGVVLVIAAAAVVTFSLAAISLETDRVTDIYEPAASNVNTLGLATSDMDRGITLYTLGGYESDLRPYVDGERRSAIALAALERLLGDDSDISPLLEAVEASRSDWLAEVAQPTIKAVRDGDEAKARELVLGNDSLTLFDRFVTDSDRLRNVIDEERSTSFDRLADLTAKMVIAVGLGMLTLLGAVVLAWVLMVNWVLSPLEDLRTQMREVARDQQLNRQIDATGPSEISAVGRDAEEMRQQLVTQIDQAVRASDQARRANQSLDSSAPVVAAIQRELGTQTDTDTGELTVVGETAAAETVLSGDFWDAVSVPGGATAVVVADVAGHGDTVGVAATRIKHLLAVALASGRSPGSALALAARRLSDEQEPMATAAIVIVDPTAGRLRWANAGHHPPIIIDREGRTRELATTGPLLSWLGGACTTEEADFHRDDLLLLFSDGLIESHDAAGEELGSTGLLQLIRTVRRDAAAPDGIVPQTLALARERAADWERDDVTLVGLAYRDPGAH